MYIHPNPFTITLVLSIPHHWLGRSGFSLLLVGVLIALSFVSGFTRRSCFCSNLSTRFLLISSSSIYFRCAQIRRYPQNGCSALIALIRSTIGEFRSTISSDSLRLIVATLLFFLTSR